MNTKDYVRLVKETSKAEFTLHKKLSEIAAFWQDKINFTDDITCSIVPSEGISLHTDHKGGSHVIPICLLGRLTDRVEIEEEELLKYSV